MAITTQSPQTKSCYEQLRRTILHGQLTAGSRLVEEKWAKCLGVHRSALREAVILLTHEGLLETGPRGGYFVPKHDREALDEVLEIRIALEIGALRTVELHLDRQTNLEPLRKTCELMQQMFDADFEFGFVEADRRFHEQLVELSGNERMLRIYRQAPLPLFPMTEPDESGRKCNMERTLTEHRLVCEHLDARRIGEAIAVLRRHLLVGHRMGLSASEHPVENDGARESVTEDVSK